MTDRASDAARSVVGPVVGSQVITGDRNKITIAAAREAARVRAPLRRATAERLLFGAPGEPVEARPLAMLRPDAGILPHHRRPEDDLLMQWCLAGTQSRVRLMVGRGGQGKTATALHLVGQLRRHGWLAGFVTLSSPNQGSGSEPEDRAWAEFAAAVTSRPVQKSPTLLVVDYAENEPVMLRRLLATIRGVPSVRLLLLSRDEGSWWPDLLATPAWTRMLHPEPLVLDSLTSHLQTGQVTDVHAEAVRCFTEHIPDAPRDLVAHHTSTRTFATTLDLYADALLSVLDSVAVARQEQPVRGTYGDPINDLLAHELRHVRSALNAQQIELGAQDRSLVLAAPFLMPAASLDDAVNLLASLELEGSYDGSVLRGIARVLGRLYPDAPADADGATGVWTSPRPDRLPDTHLLGLADRAASDADWVRLVSQLCGTDDTRLADRVTRTLLRCLSTPGAEHRFSVGLRRVTAAVDALIRTRPKGYVWPVMLLRPGQFTAAIEAALESDTGLAAHDVMQIQLHLSEIGSSTSRAFEALHVARRLVRDTEPHGPVLPGRAELHAVHLSLLSTCWYQIGEHEKALDTARDAAEIRELLALLDPVEGLQSLAMSLNNLSLHLTNLGHHDEALAAIRRATEVYQNLVDVHGDSCLPLLAESFANLARTLDAMARREEALDPARRAVELHDQLIEAKGDAHLPGLATSLLILASCLSYSGRPRQAQEHAQRAAGLLERLAAANPEAHLPTLATALTVLANIRSRLGKRDEAVEPAQQAVEVYERLSETNPHAFRPFLASSLATLSNSLLENDARYDEALASAQRAAELYEQLAREHPGAFRPQLAAAHSTLSNAYRTVGRHADAVAAGRRVVDVFSQLAESVEDRLTDLAAAVSNLGIMLGLAGEHEESLECAQRAVDLLDGLATSNPGAYLTDRGGLLDNLAAALVRMRRHDQALVAAQRALDIRNQAAEEDHGTNLRRQAASCTGLSNAYSASGQLDLALEPARRAVDLLEQLAATDEPDLAGLAMTLNNLGGLLGRLGRHEEAVGPARRSVELRKRLAAESPAHLPKLAGSLLNLGLALADVGEHDEALATAQRSVELFAELSQSDPGHLDNLAKSLNNLATLRAEIGQVGEALPLLERSAGLYRRLAEAEDPPEHLKTLAVAMSNLALLIAELGTTDDSDLALDLLLELQA